VSNYFNVHEKRKKAYVYAFQIWMNWSAVDIQIDHEKAMFIIYGCTYVVVDGHHRLNALRYLEKQKVQGLPEVVSAWIHCSSLMYLKWP
jgi:hypothetical protein